MFKVDHIGAETAASYSSDGVRALIWLNRRG
jgi:hypothetical protein